MQRSTEWDSAPASVESSVPKDGPWPRYSHGFAARARDRPRGVGFVADPLLFPGSRHDVTASLRGPRTEGSTSDVVCNRLSSRCSSLTTWGQSCGRYPPPGGSSTPLLIGTRRKMDCIRDHPPEPTERLGAVSVFRATLRAVSGSIAKCEAEGGSGMVVRGRVRICHQTPPNVVQTASRHLLGCIDGYRQRISDRRLQSIQRRVPIQGSEAAPPSTMAARLRERQRHAQR